MKNENFIYAGRNYNENYNENNFTKSNYITPRYFTPQQVQLGQPGIYDQRTNSGYNRFTNQQQSEPNKQINDSHNYTEIDDLTEYECNR